MNTSFVSRDVMASFAVEKSKNRKNNSNWSNKNGSSHSVNERPIIHINNREAISLDDWMTNPWNKIWLLNAPYLPNI